MPHRYGAEPLEPRLLLAVLYVDLHSPGPRHDGSAWDSAYVDLQLALGDAKAGDEIRLAAGTYKPTADTDRTKSFQLKSGVALSGGYGGHNAANPNQRDFQLFPTVLSGDIGIPGDKVDNSIHVVTGSGADATSILDGFVITAGNADGASSSDQSGGGMYNDSGSPTIRNCTFTGNSANTGGGMYNTNSSSPALGNCAFTANSGTGMANSDAASPILTYCIFAGNAGSGMYNVYASPTLTNCTFSGNSGSGLRNYTASPILASCTFTANSGSGMHNSTASSPRLTNCTFTANSNQDNGGGICNERSSPTLADCTFNENSAANQGGGIFNNFSSPTLINCVFTMNRAIAHNGGAIGNSGLSSPTITNCTFRENSAGESGGAIHNYSGVSPKLIGCTFTANAAKYGGAMANNKAANPSLTNCTFSLNAATEYGGAIYNIQNPSLTLINCTFSGNSAKQSGGGIYSAEFSSPTLTNCIVWGNTAPGGTQIVTDATLPHITYCDIQGGYAGIGNINADPLFVNNPGPGMDGDLRLQYGSPCIDAGRNSAVPAGVTTDLAGNVRLADMPSRPDTGWGTAPIVDIGAFEARPGPMALFAEPYAVLSGDRIPLHASALTQEPGPLIYQWEWTGDGKFDDAVGPDVTFDSAAWPAPARVPVSVRVTDSKSRSDVYSTVIQVVPVIYVDDSAVGAGNGSSWADAYTSLAEALRVVQPFYGIRVAAGAYKPTDTTDRAVSFQLKNNVVLQGGYAGYGAANPDARDALAYATILSGDIGKAGDNTDNSYHVVVGSGTDNSAVLDGFVITAGNASGSSSPSNPGGGMYNVSGSPTVRNCIFRGNSGSYYGGGMANDASSPRISNCVFSNNVASIYGGGVYNVGSSSPVLDNCTFSGNSAYSGSAVFYSSSSPTITNCIIWGNSGGSDQLSGSGAATIAYCDIQGRVPPNGSISADPQFLRNPSSGRDGRWGTADDDYGDLRLRSTSPAINVGSNAAVPAGILVDLAGGPRFVGSKVDMGAYEAPDLPAVSFTTTTQEVLEDVGTISVTLTLSRPSQLPVTIPLLLSGPATLDSDYRLLAPNPLVFEPGSTRVSFCIDILNDIRFEPSEVLTLLVGEPINAWYGGSTTHTITITDDNHEPPMQVYVDDTASGANNGSSWADAYTSLQEALQTAELGAVIWVAAGTYKPGTLRLDAFRLRNRVAIYGGFPEGGGTWQQRDPAAHPTILSGEIGNPDTIEDNSYRVVYANGVDSTAILDGVIITAGNANGSDPCDYGGGMSNVNASPSLANCIFVRNSASYCGGGMYNNDSSPNLVNCIFTLNSAALGSGMFNRSYKSTPQLVNCTFGWNFSQDASAIFDSGSSSTLTNCIVWGNNQRLEVFRLDGSMPVTYSLIQGSFSGTGNLDAEPQFVRSPWPGPDGVFGTADDDYGDLRLRAGSPALDVGSNAAIPAGISIDLAGTPRIQDDGVDLGAYEGAVVVPAPKILYVDQNATGANTGTSWDDAYTSLQSALVASADGDTIRIAAGTYKPTVTIDRSASFVLRNAVAIYGGFAGAGASNPDARDIAAYPTILSGDIGQPGDKGDNSCHVVTALGVGRSTILDGITVTLGNANGTESKQNRGGGVYLQGSSPTLTHCTFVGNSASFNGGGLSDEYSSPTLTNCSFTGNSASSGGGMSNDFSSSPMLTNCSFIGNSASSGGGMSNYSSSSPTLAACSFAGNMVTGERGTGGGMFNQSSSPTLTNCSFTGNSSSLYGGAMSNLVSSSPTLTNSCFIGNLAQIGGGMLNHSSSPTLINSSLISNSAEFGGGMSNLSSASLTLTNCIIWSNSSSIYDGSSTSTVTWCDVQGSYTGIGNIDADPQFVRNPSPGPDGLWATPDDDYGDLRLRSTSPAINAGRNAALPAGITTDLAGNPRIQGGTVDLGAYESQPTDLTLTGSPADTFLLRLTDSALEIFRNTSPDQSPPTQSLPFSSLTHLTLQGGHYTLASNLTGLSLQLDDNTQALLASPQHLASLTLAPTTTLDLADQALILSATPETKAAVLAAISRAIKSARGGDGKWLGTGLSSSAAQVNKQTGLAVMLNEKNGQPILTTFVGQPVTESDILIKYTWNGDVNLDGVVDASDYFLVDSGFITQQGQYRNGDLNLDGQVDASDYFLIDSAFIAQFAALSAENVPAAFAEATMLKAAMAPGLQPTPSVLAQLFSAKPIL